MTHNLSDEDWARLAAYLDDELEPGARTDFERWLDEDPDRHSLVDEIGGNWRETSSHLSAYRTTPRRIDVETAFQAFNERRRSFDNYSSYRGDRASEKLDKAAPYAIAGRPITARLGGLFAALILVAVMAGGLGIANDWSFFGAEGDEVAARSYVAEAGQRIRIQLSDETVVMLAPGSSLQTSERFGEGERRVNLDGEAYFDIAHASGAPFIVKSGDAETRVLGTRFNVRAFASEGVVEVAVINGKVELDTVVLVGGQLAQRDPVGNIEKSTYSSAAELLAWTNGELVFRDTPLLHVIPQLERWYNLKIHLSDADLASRMFTGTFRDVDRVDDVLTVVAHSLGITYQKRGRDVSFR